MQIAKLQETLAQLMSKLSPAGDSSNLPTAQNTPVNLPNNTAAKSTEVKSKSSMAYSEKKFNIVAYGIEESPPDTKKNCV